VKVTVKVRDGISDESKASAERHAQEAAVIDLWERDELSIREAAEELGLTYTEFLDLLAAKGIPILRRQPNERAIEEAERKLAERSP
jgi:predicted HTH domain antitoxin